MLKIGNATITKSYIGSVELSAIYIGNSLVYSSTATSTTAAPTTTTTTTTTTTAAP